MRKPNLRKTLVLFSVYIVLTLSMAQMVLADGYCRELDIAPGASDGDALIEYCTYPVEFKAMGKWGYFVYGYIPEGKDITLDIDQGPQLELENIQDPPAASHTTGSDEITVFESGAFILFTSTSTNELELSTEDDDVYVSGTEECKILMQEKFITEQLIQLEAEKEAGPIKMKLDIISDMLGLMGLYTMAIAGAPPGGGGKSCDIGGPEGGGGSGCDGGEAPSGGGGSGCDTGGPTEPPDGTTSCTTEESPPSPSPKISAPSAPSLKISQGSGPAPQAPSPKISAPPIIGSAISVPPSSGGGDKIGTSSGEGDACIVGGTESEYPSFEIAEFLGEEQVDANRVKRSYRIKPKSGHPLAGQEFIYESIMETAKVEVDVVVEAYFNDGLYKLDGTKIAYMDYDYGFIPKHGVVDIIGIEDSMFEEYKGKGIARIFNEYAFARMIGAGMTSIETGTQMMAMTGIGANPYIAKSYKNLGFGPKFAIMGMLGVAESFEIEIKDSEHFSDSLGRPYQYADMKVRGSGGALLGEFYLFLEDADGKFLEGPEGEAIYKDNLLKSTEEVRTFLIDQETNGRTIWGRVFYEAKDMDFLRTSIWDQIVWLGGKCPGELAYYPASSMDPSLFMETAAKTGIYVDPDASLSNSDGIRVKLWATAKEYGMDPDIPFSSIQVEEVEPQKFKVTFEYKGDTKTIWFYNKDANTFFPPELEGGYNTYYERWFLNYDIEPEVKAKIINRLKEGGTHMVMGRSDPAKPIFEEFPELLGLKEITRDHLVKDKYYGEDRFQICKKVTELSEDLSLKILKDVYPHAEDAFYARKGYRGTTLSQNIESFEYSLGKIEETMGEISTQHHEFIIKALDEDIIKKVTKSDVNPSISTTELISETSKKFCEFKAKFGFADVCPVEVPGEDVKVDPACAGGIEKDYPSFEIVEFLGEEQEGENAVRRRYRIKPKSGHPLAGQEFIYESVKTSTDIPFEDAASFEDALYKLDETKPDLRGKNIAFRNYQRGITEGVGQLNLISLNYEVFDEFQGKGLAKIFHEYAIARFLEADITVIQTTNLMDPQVMGANPFIAKSYRALKFAPVMDIIGTLESADQFSISIVNSQFTDSQGRPYQYADITVKDTYGNAIVEQLFLFLEDANGKFLEGPEGEAVYKNNLIGRPTEEVRAFLIDQETKGRTLWGNIPWEAKDLDFLKTEIWDKIDWVCPEGCARFPDTFPETRESFHLRDPSTLEPIIDPATGKPKNLIDTIEQKTLPEVRSRMAAEGIPGDVVIDIYGSNSYFYTLKDGTPVIRYEYINDVDYSLIFSDDVPDSKYSDVANIVKEKLGPDMAEFYGREVGTNVWFTEKLGNLKSLYGDNMPTLIDQAYHGIYIGKGEMLGEIDTILAEVKEKATSDALKARLIYLYDEAHGLAVDGKYEKALKRQIAVSHLMGDKQLTSNMVDLYIEDYPNLNDLFYIFEPQIKAKIDAIGVDMCYKLSRSLTAKEAFNIKNPGGVEYNLLEILEEARVKANSELSTKGAVGIRGSLSYFYDSEGKINWKYVKDLDVIAFDMADDVPFLKHLYDVFQSRGFDPQYDNQFIPQLFSFEVYADVATKRINIDSTGSPPMDWVFADYTEYDPHGMTFIGDSKEIDSLIESLEAMELSAETKESMRDVRVERAKNIVSDYADYEHAYRRLVEAVWVMDNYEVRDQMYAEFVTEFDGAKDFQSLYEKWLPTVEALKLSGLCYKLSKAYTTKDAYLIENTAGQKHNMLDIIYEALKKTGEEGAVAIRGSATSFYESTSKINWKYISDIDMVVIDASPNKFYTELVNSLEGRGFIMHPSGYAVEVRVNGETKMLGLDYLGQSQKYVLDPALIKDYYAEGMTLVADKERLESLQTAIEELKSTERVKARYEIILKSAKDLAYKNDYEKACRRLANAAVVLDDYGVRDGIYAEFVTEFDGAKDFQSLYEKWLPTVEALKLSGLCYKLSKAHTTKDAYLIENTKTELPPEQRVHNLLDIIHEALKVAQETTGEEGAVGIKGSTQYLYESPEKINWKYPKDIDMFAIDVSDNEFLARLVEEFTKRDFEVLPGDPDQGYDFAVKVREGGEEVIINLDRIGETKDEVFDPTRIKESYPEDMTFVGDQEQIDDITSRIEALKSAVRTEIRHGYLMEQAEDWAFVNDFEKASKRLVEAAYTVDSFELRDQMYAEFKAEFDGAKDFKPLYEKYHPIVDALKPQSRAKILDSARRYLEYSESMERYRVLLSTAIKELDEAKAIDVETKVNAFKAEIQADAVLVPDDLAGLEEDIQGIKETLTKAKEVLAVAKDLGALEDDVVRIKVHEVMDDLMKGRMDMTEDATSLYEKVGQELLKAKEDFDALPEEKKATWAEKIAEKKNSLKSKLETFIDFTDNVRTKWHQSKYYKRVYEVMEWTHEKLGKLGKDRLATLGKASGVAMVGIGVVQIILEDVGTKLEVMGDNENNPFYVMVGRKMETIATWIGVGFIAMIAIHILIALVKGGLIAALISLAMWLVLFAVLAVIITTGLKYFWCDYLNKSLAGDPICMILYGPAPIAMTASIQGTSGTCTMTGTWDGQSEMNCN